MSELLGQVIGNCQIEALLGAGGMGQVYRARHIHLDRLQALKVMHPHLALDPGFQARFRREAQAIATLEHPHIVRIFGFDEQDGRYYITMEYLPDGSLRTLLDRRAREGTPWPLNFGLDLVRQSAEALDFAHGRGIVHRDIKPDNILVARHAGPGGRSLYVAKITDFGLARMVGDGGGITSAGVTVGTPAYMSPEQCQGLPVDGRSDIYSLGVVLYEVVTGYLPFTVSRISEAVEKHVYMQPPSPRTVAPDIPVALEAIILRCLAKKPEERYQTGAELAQALRQLMQAPAPAPAAAIPEGLMVKVTDSGGKIIHSAPLTDAGLTIGRRSENQLVLDDPSVSRNHLHVEWSGRRVKIKDLGSRGGTILDGAPIKPNESYPWAIGQKLGIGPFTLQLEQMAGEQFGITLAPGQDAMSLVAGHVTPVSVTLVNRGGPDTLALAVEGWPAAWMRLPAEPIQIGAGAQMTVNLELDVPAAVGSRTGPQQVQLHARSTTQAQLSTSLKAVWTILAPPSLTLAISPESARGRDQARYSVQLTNQGGAPAHIVLMGDDPNQALAYNFARHEVHIDPGATAEVPLEVRIGRRVFGGAQTYRFSVTAAVLGSESVEVSAEFVQTSLLPI